MSLERSLVASVKAVLPTRLSDAIRVALGRATVAEGNGASARFTQLYQELYEEHARSLPPESSIGDGDYDLIGRIELSVLVQEGLSPSSTLLDFGCGTGRLAVHAIPYLAEGKYVGTDISPTMLAAAGHRTQTKNGQCSVHWIHQPDEVFPLADESIDVMCAFSVFTHMEHEDAYRYLSAAKRVVRPGGRLVLSCLPIHLRLAQEVFIASASEPPSTRWSKVRNVTTSIELIETIAVLAGWRTIRWHDGHSPSIRMFGEDRMVALGQSVLVLDRPVVAGP